MRDSLVMKADINNWNTTKNTILRAGLKYWNGTDKTLHMMFQGYYDVLSDTMSQKQGFSFLFWNLNSLLKNVL